MQQIAQQDSPEEKKGSKNFFDAVLSLAEHYSEKEDRQCHWALGRAQTRSKKEANKVTALRVSPQSMIPKPVKISL